MSERKRTILLMLGVLLVSGCARLGVLEEISIEEARAARTRSTALSPLSPIPGQLSTAVPDKIEVPDRIDLSADVDAWITITAGHDTSPRDPDVADLWFQIKVEAAALARDPYAEKFEEGSIKARAASGERFEGDFIGYRPTHNTHCTRSALSNILHFNTVVLPSPQGGVVALAGDKGAKLLCSYGWDLECKRIGLCKAEDDRYYRLKF